MYCNKCGKKIKDGARFCSSCGAKLDEHNSVKDKDGAIHYHRQLNVKTNNSANKHINEDFDEDKTVVINTQKDNYEPRYSKGRSNAQRKHTNRNNKSGGDGILIGLLIVSLITVIILGCFVGYKILYPNKNDSASNNDKNKSVVEVVEDVSQNDKAASNKAASNNVEKRKSDIKKKNKKTVKTTPAPAQQNPVANNGDFVFPDSQTVLIRREQLEPLSKEQLLYARNEIFARHGRKFKDQGIASYFGTKSWYNPTIEPEDFDSRKDTIFNDVEKQNIQLILDVEHSKGYFY